MSKLQIAYQAHRALRAYCLSLPFYGAARMNLSLSINPEFGKHFGNCSSSETDTTSSESDSDSR